MGPGTATPFLLFILAIAMDLSPSLSPPWIVTSGQMQRLEAQIFEAGMPVAALMEKAANLIAQKIIDLYPRSQGSPVGVIVGPGHNGGDALVIARELYLQGYQVKIFAPLARLKPLTQNHFNYGQALGIPQCDRLENLAGCDLIVDGLFGFGLTRPLTGPLAQIVTTLNGWPMPVVSVDVPSGLHSDTGEVLGVAVRVDHSFCLGLWKRVYFQDRALEYVGEPHLLDFGITDRFCQGVLDPAMVPQVVDRAQALSCLPLKRSPVSHKYRQGHLLLVCGSQRYAGAAILTALGARAMGLGMLSVAVPQSLKSLVVSQIPEALVIACPETVTGAIASLEPITAWERYQAVAAGPGLTLENPAILDPLLTVPCPLILDADGLGLLAQRGISALAHRVFPTVLTPHNGEFKRLFPHLDPGSDRFEAVHRATQETGAMVLLKGARTLIGHPQGKIMAIARSSAGLARGGSGDVLTGILGGLAVAPGNQGESLFFAIAAGAWCHGWAAHQTETQRTILGVDGLALAQNLLPSLQTLILAHERV